MLTAVEAWVKRDHDGRMEAMDGAGSTTSRAGSRQIDGVTTNVTEPAGCPIARRRCACGGIPSGSGFPAKRSRERCSRPSRELT